jgi:hypothetical protein
VAAAGLGGLAAAGVAGYAWPRDAAVAATGGGPAPACTATADDTRGVLHFVSRGDLTPPAVTIAYRRRQATPVAADPPYIFVAAVGYPLTGPGEPGLMILDRRGGIVWYSPNTGFPPSTGRGRMDFALQSYPGPAGADLVGRLHREGLRVRPGGDRGQLVPHHRHRKVRQVAPADLPYFTEFAADGTLLLDGQFPAGDQSYRAFTEDWTARPTEAPALAVQPNPAGGSTAYASWNGATELDSWTVWAGRSASQLSQIGSQEHNPFETAITLNSTGPYFAVTAHDVGNQVLGKSATVRVTS